MINFPFNNNFIPEEDFTGMPFPMDTLSAPMHKALMANAMNQMKPESERVAPDKNGCKIIFARAFVNDKMFWDFPLIARDFLKHEGQNIEKYKDLSYNDDMPQYSSVDTFWHRTIVHAMYEGALQGSEYCVALLKYLFKTYYSSLYKSFKRFNSVSASEIMGLAESNAELFDVYKVAVLLCIAEISGVSIKEDCDMLYYLLDEKSKEQQTYTSTEFLEFPDGLFEECLAEVETLFSDDTETVLKEKFESEKFVYNTLRYYGYPEEYVFLNIDRDQQLLVEFARVLALLKVNDSKKHYTKEDILFYSNTFEVVNAFATSTDSLYSNFIDTLSLGDDSFYDEEVLFDPEKIQPVPTSKSAKKLENIKPVETVKQEEREYSQDVLLQEIEELRSKVRIMEQEERNHRNDLQTIKRLENENKVLAGNLENSRQELAAMRSHLYRMTEKPEAVVNNDIDEMIKQLQKKQVTIVGGHINWVQKMKKSFPTWNFISPNVSVSNDSKWISNSEYVYFFTDTLSHSVYNTFVQQVRSEEVPFGYIHGVNIEANVKQMWEDLIGE